MSNINSMTFKILLIGDENVGKTSLSYRFCEGKQPLELSPTIGVDIRQHIISIDNDTITVKLTLFSQDNDSNEYIILSIHFLGLAYDHQPYSSLLVLSEFKEIKQLRLWDLGRCETGAKSTDHYFNNVNAIVFIYDVSNIKSFEYLKTWIENNIKHFDNVLKIMIANKCDLDNSISTNLAQQFADKYNMPLFETSSMLDSENDNINSIFLTVAYKLKSNKLLITNSSETKFVTNSVTPESKCCIQ